MPLMPWALLAGALAVIGVAPGPAGLDLALIWLGAFAVTRGVILLAPFEWAGVVLDIALLPLCLALGIDAGGWYVVPSLLAFLWSDARLPSRSASAGG